MFIRVTLTEKLVENEIFRISLQCKYISIHLNLQKYIRKLSNAYFSLSEGIFYCIAL